MKVLILGPLPPPTAGDSLALQVLKDELHKTVDIDVVNFNKKMQKNFFTWFRRFIEIAKILIQVAKKKGKADVIYFSISQSDLGNVRDIFIYLICFKKLSKVVIHLHGGPGLKKILSDSNSTIYKINSFFLRRLAGVIVLGKSQVPIFENIIDQKKLHIVPNFAEDYLFRTVNETNAKFRKIEVLNILFLSNMIYDKGYELLLDAYLSLDECLKTSVVLNFVGEFESRKNRLDFLRKIESLEHIKYWGFKSGQEKRRFFECAHIFCLPTHYAYEGQPISILEAYASGCVVITTNHSGIADVFRDGLNGFQVEKNSVASLRSVLEKAVQSKNELLAIGINNRNLAEERYRTSTYNQSLRKIVASVV